MPKDRSRQGQEPKQGDLKKPPNAFLVFTIKNREAVRRKQDVNTSNSKLLSILSRIWNSMSSADKDPYYEESERRFDEFHKRNPGHTKFKRGPNKLDKNLKSRPRKKTSEPHRIDFPDRQTVFRVQTPDVEVYNEQRVEAGTSARRSQDYVEIEWDVVQVDCLDDPPMPKRRQRDVWCSPMISPVNNDSAFPARADRLDRSTYIETNARHHHDHAGSLPTTTTTNKFDIFAPSSSFNGRQHSPIEAPTNITDGIDGFRFFTNTSADRQSEALHSPTHFTHMLGVKGAFYSPNMSDNSFSSSTSSVPLPSSSIYSESMAGSPADYLPVTPASAVSQFSPEVAYLQQQGYWQLNYSKPGSQEFGLGLTLGPAHGELDTSQSMPSSLQPTYVDNHSSLESYGYVNTTRSSTSNSSMSSSMPESIHPSQENNLQWASSAVSGSPPWSTYNSLLPNLDSSVGDFQTPYEESVQGSIPTNLSLLPTTENWHAPFLSWNEQQPTVPSELRNAATSAQAYYPAASFRTSGPPSNGASRASSLPVEQTLTSLSSSSRLRGASQGRAQGAGSPTTIPSLSDSVGLVSKPLFCPSDAQQASLTPDSSTWLTHHEAGLFGAGFSSLSLPAGGDSLEHNELHTAALKALYGLVPFPPLS